MGFGTIAAQTIMFISIIIVATGLVFVYNSIMDDTSNSLRVQGELISNRIKTDLEIVSSSYDNDSQTVNVYVKNTGKTKLDIEKVDVFLDEKRIPRNDANRSIEVLPDTEIRNTGIWDPSEDIAIQIQRSLNDTSKHSVQVTTQYAISDIDSFSLP